jgi:hypothetical protein
MLAMPPIHSTSLQFVTGPYVFAGLAVKGIVSFRGLKIRRSHFKGEPVWDSRDNGGNSLFYVSRCDGLASGWHRVSDFAFADLIGLARLFNTARSKMTRGRR